MSNRLLLKVHISHSAKYVLCLDISYVQRGNQAEIEAFIVELEENRDDKVMREVESY